MSDNAYGQWLDSLSPERLDKVLRSQDAQHRWFAFWCRAGHYIGSPLAGLCHEVPFWIGQMLFGNPYRVFQR